MKKIISALMIVLTIGIVGCGAEEEELFSLNGTYLTFENGSHMIVDEINGPIVMGNETGDENIFGPLKSGDKIRVEAGLIAESYPGQTTIYDLDFIEEGNIDDIREGIIKDLTDMGWIIK